ARFLRIGARDIQRVIFCRDDVNRDNIDSPSILTHSDEKDVTGSIITDKNKIGNEVRASSSYTNSLDHKSSCISGMDTVLQLRQNLVKQGNFLWFQSANAVVIRLQYNSRFLARQRHGKIQL